MKIVSIILVLMMILFPLYGCAVTPGKIAQPEMAASKPESTTLPATSLTNSPSFSNASSPKPLPTPTATQTPLPTRSPEGIAADNTMAAEYFNRIGFTSLGSSRGITRWAHQIKIEITGNPNEEDKAALGNLLSVLRGVPNLPEITQTATKGDIIIYYIPKSQAKGISSLYAGDEAFVSIGNESKSSAHSLLNGRIMISDEMKDQAKRTGKLLSFFFLALGLQADSKSQYSDSVLNFKALQTTPSKLDLVMLRLLYDPSIKPGGKDTAEMAQVKKLLSNWLDWYQQ